MINTWDNASLSEALGIEINQNIVANKVQFNSKDVQSGDLFIALKGNTDGHIYVKDAIDRGASCAIVERNVDIPDKSKLIVVDDASIALTRLAKYKRSKSKATFIGVTGSAGKTSTKEGLYDILSHFNKSFASRGNFNNHIGVPLNLASMPDDTKYAVLEMGMNNPGEISPLSDLAQPDIAIITNILPVHIENMGSIDGIANEKCQIFSGLSSSGVALLNRDSDHFMHCQNVLSQMKPLAQLYSFGEHKDADSRLLWYDFDGNIANIRYSVRGKEIDISTHLAGKHMAINIASMLLVADILNLELTKVASVIESLTPLEGRGKLLKTNVAGKNCTIIYDCYNANPSSVQSSLEHFSDMKHSNKIAILADMLELGNEAERYHKELAPYVINSEVGCLCTVGPLMRNLYNELKHNVKTIHFDNSEDLYAAMHDLVTEESMILFKGSKGMKLSSVVERLIKQDK